MQYWPLFLLLTISSLLIVHNADAKRLNLTSHWVLTSESEAISVTRLTIPSSVHTALYFYGVVGDLLYRFEDVNLRWIARVPDWTYTNRFQLSDDDLASPISLTLESVDTIASVWLNGNNILNATNQFIAYELTNLNDILQNQNILEIQFSSPIDYALEQAYRYPYAVPPVCPPDTQHGECQVNFMRKQQCSFSWDWGPAFLSIGLTAPVYLSILDSFDFDFAASVSSRDQQPDLSNWIISLDIKLNQTTANLAKYATIRVQIDSIEFNYEQTNVAILGSDNLISMQLGLSDEDYPLQLWWPSGYGEQILYELKVTIELDNASHREKSKTIGFRSIELVQDPIDAKNASYGLTFYFKINKQPMFLKGSNWIPADAFQEFISEDKLLWLLRSARLANMNVLRVWGGGVYESDTFYRLADETGLMIWQDFMFACATYPTNEVFLENVRQEVTYQVNRLKHHVSIIIWAGNNENEAAVSTNWYNTDINKVRPTITLFIQPFCNNLI
jgi:beta-mannosidase